MSRPARSVRTAGIVLVYTVVFLGLLPALLWFTGGRVDHLLSFGPVGAGGRIAGVVLLAAGTAGLAASMLALAVRGRGWPISHLPPRRLVRGGPYRLLRHPIYASFVAAFAGMGLAAGSWGRGLGAPGLLAAGAAIYALGFEEPKLRSRHGEAWERYRRAVPGTVPGGRPRSAPSVRLGPAWAVLVPRLERLAGRTVLFSLGDSVWVTYGALVAAGGWVMSVWLGGLLIGSGLATGRAGLYVVGLAAAMLVGGRAVWLAYQLPRLLREPVATLRTVGFVSWGGLLGLVAFTLAFAAATGGGALRLLDRALLAVLPCMALGRVGCLTYGCCYGRPWRHGIRWTGSEAKAVREQGRAGSVPRVPTQLVEGAGALAVLVPAALLTATPVPAGTVACVVVLLYGVLRFGTDCLRDEPRLTGWRLTAGQLASLATAAAAWTALFLLDGPPGWARPAWELAAADLLRGLPAAAAATLLAFVVCGFHWRQVGRW